MAGKIKLDDRDLKMLAILQREGRIAKAALAERVNLSPTPCWERLKRLEEAGIIEGYGARVSLKAFFHYSLADSPCSPRGVFDQIAIRNSDDWI
jgi:DNA-binding Lrp family transcriptional regulator